MSAKFKAKKDCPHWGTECGYCSLLVENLCETRGVCGFYPPTQKERGEKIRAMRAAQRVAAAKKQSKRKGK